MKRLRLSALVLVAICTGSVCWTCAHWSGSIPGAVEGRLEHGGRTRTFLSIVPEGPGPFPVVLALHGRLGTGTQMLKLSGLAPLGQRERFMVVAPDGIGRSWADGRNTSPASKEGVDDVGFLVALVESLVAKGPVIGACEGMKFAVSECLVPPASKLFVFSDGAYEIQRKDGTMMGHGDLQSLLARAPRDAAVEWVLEQLRLINSQTFFDDDVSLVELTFS